MQAIKLIYIAGLSLVISPAIAGSFACNSSDNSYHHCDLASASARDIHLQRVTGGNCEANNAWGVDDAGVWVDNGCSAVFEYIENDGNGADAEVVPEVVDPYYAPGFYGIGYYNGNYDDCNNHDCNNNHQYNHNDNQERYEENDSRAAGGFHGGGGGRR